MNTLTLPNGLQIVYRQTLDNPVSAAHLFFNRGTADEAKAERGVTTLMWSLLLKGTETRSARKIAEDLEGLGAHAGGGSTHDNSHASCHAIGDYFLAALEIFADTLFHPAYLPHEIEKEKTALVAAIQSKKESIFSVAQEAMSKNLFGAHPYAVQTIGEEKTVPSLTIEHVRRRHKLVVVPNGAVLSMASPLSFSSLLPVIKRLFGPTGWPKSKTKPPALKAAPAKTPARAIELKEHFEQAFLMLGFPVVPILSPDYVPLKLLAIALGGGMSSRLFKSLREERGLAYDVGAYVAGRRKGSSFVVYMGLQPSKLAEAKKEILRELQRIRQEKIPPSELADVKNYFKGSFILDHQTNSQRSYYVGWSLTSGKGLNYEKDFLKKIERTTPAILQNVARKYLTASPVSIQISPRAKNEVA